jgi:hypothetical protein
MTLSQNFAPSVCSIQKAQNFFLAIGIESERDIDRLVLDEALIADLDPQGVQENDRVDGIERPVLPRANLVEDGVGDPADEIGRDVDAIKLGQAALDLAHRQAAGVQAQDLAVEPVEPGLAFGDKLRLEGSRPVARDRYLDLSISVKSVFELVPLRLLPLPLPAGSPFS